MTVDQWEQLPADKSDAKRALRAAAFTTNEGRHIVHSFAGGGGLFLGADSDLDAILIDVENAFEVAWVTHPLEHDLAVVGGDGHVMFYAVRRPERSA